MRSQMWKLFVIALVGGAGWFFYRLPPLPPPQSAESFMSVAPTAEVSLPPLVRVNDRQPLPPSVNLAVPFTPQAPLANWDAAHEEACEEAALLMVDAFYRGEPAGLLDAMESEKTLQEMIAAEKKLFGFFEDTTVQQTAEFARAYLGYEQVEVLAQPSIDDLKRHLAAGHPVIVPTSGRILANPYFSGDGPLYHMIVLTGYTSDGFIVNDPGTRRGANWVYSFDLILRAMHDWEVPEGIEDHPDDIPAEKKTALVIYP